MLKAFLEAVKGRKFQSQNFWTECRNFLDCFWTIQVEFRDYFWTVLAEFFKLFSDSPDKNFRTVFRQFRIEFGFDPETYVCRFCSVSCYHSNSVTNYEGTKRCPVLCESEIWAILCVIVVRY